MNIDGFIAAGGINIWQLNKVDGNDATKLWETSSLLNLGESTEKLIEDLTMASFGLLMGMIMLELVRLQLGKELKAQYKIFVIKVIFIASLMAWPVYSSLCSFSVNFFDATIQEVFTKDESMNALFGFMDISKRAMYSTFASSTSDSMTMKTISTQGFMQSAFYLVFFVVWWAIPLFLGAIIQALYLIGPIFLPFGVFLPLSGIAGGWVRLFVGLQFGYLLLALSFVLMLSAQTIEATSAVSASQELFSTVGFSLVGILVCLGMPSFGIRLVGSSLNLMSWKK